MVEEKRDLDSLLGFLGFAKKNGYFDPGTAGRCNHRLVYPVAHKIRSTPLRRGGQQRNWSSLRLENCSHSYWSIYY